MRSAVVTKMQSVMGKMQSVKQFNNKDVEVKYGDWSKICFDEE